MHSLNIRSFLNQTTLWKCPVSNPLWRGSVGEAICHLCQTNAYVFQAVNNIFLTYSIWTAQRLGYSLNFFFICTFIAKPADGAAS